MMCKFDKRIPAFSSLYCMFRAQGNNKNNNVNCSYFGVHYASCTNKSNGAEKTQETMESVIEESKDIQTLTVYNTSSQEERPKKGKQLSVTICQQP